MKKIKQEIKQKLFFLVPGIFKKKVKDFYYDTLIYPIYRLKYLIYYGKIDFFDSIAIETTTYCNLRCKNCPNSIYERGILKNKKMMDINLFKKIIDDLSKAGYRGNLMLHFYGEPLTDERLPNLVKYSRKKLPLATIQINTNGFLLTIENYRNLIRSGVNKFFITQYVNIMPIGVKEVLYYLNRRPKKENKIEYRVLGEDIGLSNRGGEINVKKVVDFERPICTYPNVGMHIDYEGNVVLCCNDYHSSVKLGNVKKEDIVKIWNSGFYKKLRNEIRARKYRLKICKKCVGIIR